MYLVYLDGERSKDLKPVKIGEGGGSKRKYLPTYFLDGL